jgi:LmbE family N-acetylglucosaminyl deacetylase
MRRLLSAALLALVASPHASCAVQAGSGADPAGLGDRGSAAVHQAFLDVTNPFTVMCVACHPDDEDGSSLTLERRMYGARTVTLFATSGEGGQNAVGPELYDELGRIRERETREAAEIQGSEPYFLRLRDFGFSKSGDEAMAYWERQMGGHEALLELFVAAIRTIRPDVIITNHDTSTGHGQHQATSRLLHEAFEVAADSARFPKAGAAWKPQALYVRAPQSVKASVVMDANTYDRVRGLTYREQAFRALLRHATQGPWRLEFLSGSARYRLSAGAIAKNPAGIGSPLTGGLAIAEGKFFIPSADRSSDRSGFLKGLTSALVRPDLSQPDRTRIRSAIGAAHGLSLDFRLDAESVTPGGSVDATLVLANGGSAPVTIESIGIAAPNCTYTLANQQSVAAGLLAPGETRLVRVSLKAPVDPAVLDRTKERTVVERVVDSGLPVEHEPGGGTAIVSAEAVVSAAGKQLSATATRYVRVEPPLRLSIPPAIAADDHGTSSPLAVRIQNVSTAPVSFVLSGSSAGDEVAGSLEPNDERTFRVRAAAAVTALRRSANGSGPAAVLAVAPVRLLRQHVEVANGLRVAYVRSYENTIPESLDLLGVDHTELTPAAVRDADLSRFDTIVVDNRAYLKYPELARVNARLLEFARAGGNLVVFYHKSGEYDASLAPYPITLGGKRITDENAPVEILAPKHTLFTYPNTIGSADFEGWIQERGLYFPSAWDSRYEALLSSHDPGEEPLTGGLLVARHGNGTFVYTSYVWYRQLRGFVPGGFRFFANLISLPKAPKA